LLPSLLSLTNFANNNSLGSFTSHNLADVSTLSSVPGEEMIPGMDAKARGEEGKGTGTELLGPASGQALQGLGKGTFGGGADLTEWGQQRNPWDDGNPQETAGPSGRRNQDEDKHDDSDQYQGMFWKQLQQQRQQQQKREDGFGNEASQQQQRRENGFHVSGLAKSGGHESAVAHFTQLQRGRTPPGSPYDEPNQAWTRAPSSSPQPEPNHARSRPSSGAHRDPRGNRPSSLSHEPDEAQGRAASGSPRHDQGKSKPSTFLSELAQAIQPSVKGKDHRWLTQHCTIILSAFQCSAVLCCAMLRCAALRCAALRCHMCACAHMLRMSCCVPCSSALCCAVLHAAVPCYAKLFRTKCPDCCALHFAAALQMGFDIGCTICR